MDTEIEKPIASTAERLKETLDRRHMTAAELCRRTGISSASMSQYMKGKVNPKQDRIYLIAVHLRCRPAWLMGYDIEPGFNASNRSAYEKRLASLDDPEFIAREMADIPNDLKYYKRSDRFAKMHRMFSNVDADTQNAMLERIKELYDLYQFRKNQEGGDKS